MLEIRPTCEHCDKPLPPDSQEALICSYECTFCKDCVTELLQNVCPNCGGGFEKRPVRPSAQLQKYPARVDKVFNLIKMSVFAGLLEQQKNVPPHLR